MIRILAAAFAVTVAASVVTGGNRAVIYLAFFGTLAALVVPLVQGRTALKCPHCRKRVKLGAAACHHCGRAVARPS